MTGFRDVGQALFPGIPPPPGAAAVVSDLIRNMAVDPESIHGISHWERVAWFGAYICRREQANGLVAAWFACFHDCRRLNDGSDRGHGPRAADFLKLFSPGDLGLTRAEKETLAFACRHHTHERVTEDPTVWACWDADRLDLPRIGVAVDPSRLFTESARRVVRSPEMLSPDIAGSAPGGGGKRKPQPV